MTLEDDLSFYTALGEMLERSVAAVIEATPAAGAPKGSAERPLCYPCAWKTCSRPARAASPYCPQHEADYALGR